MTMDALPNLPTPALAGAAALLVALLALVGLALRARRRAAREAALVDAVDAVDEAGEPVEVTTEEDDRRTEVRVLRAQVRTLEQALQEAMYNAATIAAAERLGRADLLELVRPVESVATAGGDAAEDPADVVEEAADALASYQRQVLLAVRAVELRTAAGDDARHAVSRVAAAIARLDAADVFARPVLAAVARPADQAPQASALVPSVPTAVAAIATAPEPEVAPRTEAESAPLPAAEPIESGPIEARPTESEPTEPVPAEPAAEVELVLPVPPPATAESRRTRRWLRRTAA